MQEIGAQCDLAVVLSILDDGTALQTRALLLDARTREPDDLVGEDATIGGRLTLLGHYRDGLVFETSDNVNLGYGPSAKCHQSSKNVEI